MKWINAKEEPPKDFNERGRTKQYLVFIDNPYFTDGNYHVSFYERHPYHDKFNSWIGIEPNVHHDKEMPNVTHYCELPEKPI